ncbi:hypothetical protein RN001_003374 [Aquatica leii]|uniref:Adenylate cyclase-stimulating G alpha protein n=1 Tax=Aquatica leii TaxID=1421715 RepID=A0AAN7QP23_9COLE|nr:hypothetical protein RN001_003374 [Aquatica leii]
MEDGEKGNNSNASDKNNITKSTNTKIQNKLTTALVRYAIPRPISYWRKLTSNKKQKRISKRIDKDLKKDDHDYHEILVIGDKGSGKTTICKQMRVLYGNEFSEVEKRKFVKIIIQNMREGVLTLVNRAFKIEKLENIDYETKQKINFIENYNFKDENSQKFYRCVENLWNNPLLQTTISSINETPLVTATKYFVTKLDVLRCKNYLPTNDDILHCYEPTKAAVEIRFKSEYFYHKMFEIPNLKYEKRLWKQVVNGVKAILFVIPCNIFLEQRNKKPNPLSVTIKELKDFQKFAWVSSSLRYIIFLNKIDLFDETILKQTINLQECFPGFSEDKTLGVKEDCVLRNIKTFILSKFTEEVMICETTWHSWYLHFTCAVDSEATSIVYKECENIIRESYICTYQLY